jgi:hypothetical protein
MGDNAQADKPGVRDNVPSRGRRVARDVHLGIQESFSKAAEDGDEQVEDAGDSRETLHPAVQVPGWIAGAPGLRTGPERTGSSVDVGFVDVDGDGTADIAQRILHSQFTATNGEAGFRAGILYWSRGAAIPQDLLAEEQDPLLGSRTSVRYLPATDFQWQDGVPDGKPPAGGIVPLWAALRPWCDQSHPSRTASTAGRLSERRG